jgi:hypothetical protein
LSLHLVFQIGELSRWNLNWRVAGVDEGHFAVAAAADAGVSVFEAVHQKWPVVQTYVGVVVKAFFSSLDLRVVKISESYRWGLLVIVRIFIVEANFELFDGSLFVKLVNVRFVMAVGG